MIKLLFIGILCYGGYMIWQKVPYLLLTPYPKITHDIKQVLDNAKNNIFDTLDISNTKKPYQACDAIKGNYTLIINQSMSFFMGRTIKLVGCSQINASKRLGCYFEINLNEKDQFINYTGQLCKY